MTLARQLACALRDIAPNLSTEGLAAALSLDLQPAEHARYRYLPASLRVEYDCLASARQQRHWVRRACVCRMLDMLELAREEPETSINAIVEEVFGLDEPLLLSSTKRIA